MKNNKYFLFTKYIASSGISFFLDLLLFNIFTIIFSGEQFFIVYASFAARAISLVINYFINKIFVFDSRAKNKQFSKYIILAILNIIISALMVSVLHSALKIIKAIYIKIVIDIIIFILNYFIQKNYIFFK